MSKNDEKTNAPEASTETEKKATPKKILVELVRFLESANTPLAEIQKFFNESIAASLVTFAEEIKKTAVRGLPAVERLALVQAQKDKHWDEMPDRKKDPEAFAKWEYAGFQLLQRENRINREIKDGGASRGKGGAANNAKA